MKEIYCSNNYWTPKYTANWSWRSLQSNYFLSLVWWLSLWFSPFAIKKCNIYFSFNECKEVRGSCIAEQRTKTWMHKKIDGNTSDPELRKKRVQKINKWMNHYKAEFTFIIHWVDLELSGSFKTVCIKVDYRYLYYLLLDKLIYLTYLTYLQS